MISIEHWPSPFENAPTFDADGVLETAPQQDEQQDADPGMFPAEIE